MSYQRINWQDGESGGTPVSAANLNKMDEQIELNEINIATNTKNITTNTKSIDAINQNKQDKILSGTILPSEVVNGQIFLLYN